VFSHCVALLQLLQVLLLLFGLARVCRHHSQIKLSGVPDVMRWSAEGPTAQMGQDLEKAGSPAEAVAVVAAFINKTA
jgi:hypothetical protein